MKEKFRRKETSMIYENVAVIELAAGLGTRFGEKKQFVEFHGKQIWRHIYDKVLKLVPQENVVVVGVDIPGGIVRSQSVINGLVALKEKDKRFDRIVIVEAARPLVTIEQLKDIIEDNHKSTTYALPLVSTIIKKDGTYLNRSDYYKMSTPVAFDYELFSMAYLSDKHYDFTDDTRVMYEHYGLRPYFLEGSDNLLKLTYQSDLVVLETLLKRYEEEES